MTADDAWIACMCVAELVRSCETANLPLTADERQSEQTTVKLHMTHAMGVVSDDVRECSGLTHDSRRCVDSVCVCG